GSLYQGVSYPLISDIGGWYLVDLGGRIGYVNKKHVVSEFTANDKYFEVTTRTAIYLKAGDSSTRVGAVDQGQVFPRIRDYGSYHEIKFGNTVGYVKKEYTKPGNGSKINNLNKSYKNTKQLFKPSLNIAVYEKTDNGLRQFGSLYQGVSYPLISDIGGWYLVDLGGRIGYVNKKHVVSEFTANDKYFEVTTRTAIYIKKENRLIAVGAVDQGEVFPRISDTGGYHVIKFGNDIGYVRKVYTKPGDGWKIKNINTAFENSKTLFKPVINVAVYEKTDTGLKQFSSLYKDVTYPMISDIGDWVLVDVSGRLGYVSKSNLDIIGQKYTSYDLTLDEALQIQLEANPQTTNNYKTYVSKDFINDKNEVTASALNVRGGPSTDYWVVGQLKNGNKVKIIREINGWYEIEFSKSRFTVNASPSDTLYYLDPLNFLNDSIQKFQFLDLARGSDVSASILNNFLKGKGILAGQGQAFIDASRIHGINDIYLVSHAILETGHGSSTLAQGVQYNGTTVYNMYGYGANDSCPVTCGAKKAYELGWDTPYKAIVGGAKFIGNGYIKKGQNTLYKMRWDPEFMANNNRYGKQYATDIGWASKQVNTMYNLYQQLDSYTLYLDIPVYK
ncbi:SH3 domain-containing protein, partial [Virgibacillus sp. W0430]|uniref:SH3 domain-containing protein n=1 Tax=Virgibacillus sp. W0430 TaxID=3391580 RepID=UPI003F471EA3